VRLAQGARLKATLKKNQQKPRQPVSKPAVKQISPMCSMFDVMIINMEGKPNETTTTTAKTTENGTPTIWKQRLDPHFATITLIVT
jgi:hypothetical protein